MLTIFGLGNPGEEYEGTRHNSGRSVVSNFAKRMGFEGWKEDGKAFALILSGTLGSLKLKLALPQTFMNKSGKSVSYFIKSLKAAESAIVVHDDLDLPLGVIRISFGRGSGGHKGVESVIRALKTEKFIRLRVGISKESKGRAKKPIGEEMVQKFVLGKFDKKEQEIFKDVLKRSSQALQKIVEEGRAMAMNEYNRS